MCSRPRSHSHRPGEFLLAVEGLKGWLAPGFGMWVRSGGEKGAPECAPPQLCGRTWEPVEGSWGDVISNFPTPGSSPLKLGGNLRTGNPSPPVEGLPRDLHVQRKGVCFSPSTWSAHEGLCL